MAKRSNKLTAEEYEAYIEERVKQRLKEEAEEEAKLREEFLHERCYTLDGKPLPTEAERIEQDVERYRRELTEARFEAWKAFREFCKRLEAE